MVLIDCHCHLFEMKNYRLPPDIRVVVVGYSPSSNIKAAELGRQGHPFVLGIAPQTAIRQDLSKLDEWTAFIRQSRPNAIGEVGLDYKWAESMEDVEKQKMVFRAMIVLARSMSLPLVIHSRNNPNDNEVPRNAVDDILPMISGCSFLMHFYSGNREQAKQITAMGGYISVTQLHSKERRKVIEDVPLERLMVESDAPYVGRTPETIREAIGYISEIKSIPQKEVAEQTAKNAMEFFKFGV